MDEPIPPWVPEVAPGIRADVYPVEPARHLHNPYFRYPAELRLDRAAVIHGYSERRLPYEFHSRLSTERPPPLSSSQPQHLTPSLTTSDLTKLKNGLIALRRTRPTKLQRVKAASPPKQNASRANLRHFPLQKHPLSQNLDEWFNRLSKAPHNPLSELTHSVPLGPAIVRAAGKVVEMMATRSISTQRAAWYIRIAVLNECIRQIRPDRPPPSPKLFWTKQLCGLLKTEIDAIRARKTPMLGSMERVAFWQYILDLARWQADEGLLDVSKWITAIAQALRVELISSQSFSAPGTKITVMAARRFLPEFLSSADGARLLLDSLLRGSNLIITAHRASCASSTRETAKGKIIHRKATRRASSSASPSVAAATMTTFSLKSTPDLCHLEVMQLLKSGLNALQVHSQQDKAEEFSMPIFEQLVQKGLETLHIAKDKGKEREPKPDYRTKEERLGSPNIAIRHFETLATHGDVARVTSILKQAYKERGGTPMAVRKVCSWALSSMVADRAEAICVATAILHQLAADPASAGSTTLKSSKNRTTPKRYKKGIHQVRNAMTPPTLGNLNNGPPSPPLQRDIWHFLKHYANDRIPETGKGEGIVKELHGGTQAENIEGDDSVVRFIAHLCRHDLLSLPGFVRDVSRLAATNHRGASFLVKCLALLPDPVDKSVSDCRRSILRKYGYISPTKQCYPRGVCDKSIRIACSGDVNAMDIQVDALISQGDTNVILTSIDSLCQRDLKSITGNVTEVQEKIATMASFMVSLGEAGTATEWVMDSLSRLDSGGLWNNECMASRRANLTIAFTQLASHLSRYIAACGYLESIFILMTNIWSRPWKTRDLETQLMRTLSSFARYYGCRIRPVTSYWIRMAARNLKQIASDRNGLSCVPLALACMRGLHDPKPAGSIALADVLDLSKKENLGMNADDDVSQLASQTELNGDRISELRAYFTTINGAFPIASLFGSGCTASDVFGSVVIPVLRDSFLGSECASSPKSSFSQHSATALHLICSHQNDMRLQGIRPSILLELVTLFFLGCYYGHTNTSESLEVLFSIKWVWKILAPYASMELAKRLRNRVDFYWSRVVVGKKSTLDDKKRLPATLFNMVSLLCRKQTGGDEEMVLKTIGTTSFGKVEMLLALLAQHRRESGEEDEFGLKVSNQATKLNCKHLSRSLVLIALRCCPQEIFMQSVAGYIGHQASRGLQVSLDCVLKGLIVDASQNDLRAVCLQWCRVDEAQRALLETAIGNLKPEHAGDVEDSLFEQLVSASKLLTEAMAEGRVPSNIFRDGQIISDALESRLLCILRAPRLPQRADWWRQRAQQIAKLVKSAAGLLTKSGISAACKLLDLCLRSIKELSISDENTQKDVAISQIFEWPINQELKKTLEAALVPAMRWVESSERNSIARLLPPSSTYCTTSTNHVRVLNGDGSVVDNWMLLEGYGRGENQASAIPPENMWRQGEMMIDKDRVVGTVHLKRTYSTFASLAV
ncbi:unnamed protein product [Agarophyton chilense]|eukprot:gb/GEZJ01000865.1/.p1 GENE.gb/GEZJ01000865.1/~~gb/GEZJ01000865.1/.p1  ORF type:complete len:1517 (+),score=179.30 gb/GEZJ01000865.1/:120-4553(+)